MIIIIIIIIIYNFHKTIEIKYELKRELTKSLFKMSLVNL